MPEKRELAHIFPTRTGNFAYHSKTLIDFDACPTFGILVTAMEGPRVQALSSMGAS